MVAEAVVVVVITAKAGDAAGAAEELAAELDRDGRHVVRCLRLRLRLGLWPLIMLLLSFCHRGWSTSRGITAARIFRLSEWMKCRNGRTRSRRAGSWPTSSVGEQDCIAPLKTATPIVWLFYIESSVRYS